MRQLATLLQHLNKLINRAYRDTPARKLVDAPIARKFKIIIQILGATWPILIITNSVSKLQRRIVEFLINFPFLDSFPRLF